jgi:hypothetical protein
MGPPHQFVSTMYMQSACQAGLWPARCRKDKQNQLIRKFGKNLFERCSGSADRPGMYFLYTRCTQSKFFYHIFNNLVCFLGVYLFNAGAGYGEIDWQLNDKYEKKAPHRGAFIGSWLLE